MKDNSDLRNKATELVEKYGSKAIEIAERKVNAFPKDVNSREKDSALMLLSEVENLIEKKLN
jgi:hypothetical protein